MEINAIEGSKQQQQVDDESGRKIFTHKSSTTVNAK
jgi:hypothetical protein